MKNSNKILISTLVAAAAATFAAPAFAAFTTGDDGLPVTTGFTEASGAMATDATISSQTVYTYTDGNENTSVNITLNSDAKFLAPETTSMMSLGTVSGSGDVWFSQGRWRANDSTTLSNTGAIYVSGAQLWLTGSNDRTLSNNIFLGTSSFSESGLTALNNSSLRVGATTTLSGTTTILSEGAKISFQSSKNLTISKLAGSGTLTVSRYDGSSTMTISESSAFTGNISLAASNMTLVFAGSSAGTHKVGTLTAEQGAGSGTAITVDSGATVSATSLTNSWGISTLTVNGTLNVSGNFQYSSGNMTNTITGTGTISAGTFTVGNVGAYVVDGGVTLNIGSGGIAAGTSNGYTLTLKNATIGASADWTASALQNAITLGATGDSATTFNTNSHTITLNNSLTGSGNLKKIGEGTLKISAGANLSGDVTVGAGTLAITAGGTISGATTVSGGALTTAGTTTLSGALSLTSGSLTTSGTTTLGTTTVSGGTLTLGGTVNLSSAITVSSGTVSVTTDSVVFNLIDSLKTSDSTDASYTLISGASEVTNWSSLTKSNFTIDGVDLGRKDVTVSTDGIVVITGSSANLVWAGTTDSSTWTTSSTTWTKDSASDSFYSDDNVTFDSTAANKTVTLAADGDVHVGTMTVSDDYTFAQGDDGSTTGTSVASATIYGTTLTIDSGKTMTFGDGNDNLHLAFDDIQLSGTLLIKTNSDDIGWGKLTFATEGATLNIDDSGNNGIAMSETVVNANASITSTWGCPVDLGALSGSGTLTLSGSSSDDKLSFSTTGGSLGGLTIATQSSKTLPVSVIGNGTLAVNGKLTVNGSGTAKISGTLSATSLENWATFELADNANVTISGTADMSKWSGSSTSAKTLKIGSGATLSITGDLTNDAGLTISNSGTLDVSGTLSYLSGDGWTTNTFSGDGVIKAKGLSIDNVTQLNVSGTTMILGDSGITLGSGSNDGRGLRFGAATLGASADWSSSMAIGLSDATTGITLNTGSYADGAFSSETGYTITLSGVISDADSTAGKLTKAGAGTLKLSGANTFTGDITVSAGTLEAANATALGSATNTTRTVSVASGATLSLGADAALAGTFTLDGALTSSDSTNHTLTLSGTNTFGSAATVAATTALVFNGGTTTINSVSSSANNTFTAALQGDLTIGSGATVYGTVNDQINYNASSTQTVTVSGDLKLGTSANNYASGVRWTFGANNKLVLNNGKITGAGDSSTNGGNYGALDFYAANTVKASGTSSIESVRIRGVALTTEVDEGSTLTIAKISPNTDDASTTNSKLGTLVKTGAGTLILSGENNFASGGVTVSAGTLEVSHASALGTSGASVASGATLKLDVALANAGTVSFAEGAKIAVDLDAIGKDSSSTTEKYIYKLITETTITFGNAASEASLTTLSADVADYSSYLDVSSLGDLADYALSLTVDNNSLILTISIPEPSAFGLLAGLGALAFAISRRRRSRKN